MKLTKYINQKVSGFYDIGKRYSLDLYANNENDYEELLKNINTKTKNIEIEKNEKNLGVRVLSYSVGDVYKYQQAKGLNFRLEHL